MTRNDMAFIFGLDTFFFGIQAYAHLVAGIGAGCCLLAYFLAPKVALTFTHELRRAQEQTPREMQWHVDGVPVEPGPTGDWRFVPPGGGGGGGGGEQQ